MHLNVGLEPSVHGPILMFLAMSGTAARNGAELRSVWRPLKFSSVVADLRPRQQTTRF